MIPKTIVCVHGSADMYGSSRSLLRLVTNLSKRYNPLVVLPENGPLVKALRQSGVEVVVLPWLQRNVLGRHAFHGINLLAFLITFLPNVLRFAFFLRKRQADLVHTNNTTMIVPSCSATLAQVPHFWHIRETLDEYFELWDQFATTETSLIWRSTAYLALRFWSLYVRFIYAFSMKVICVSNAVCRSFWELGLNERTCVIYNGLEIPYYTSPAIKPLSLDSSLKEPETYCFVGTVGEIRAGKGQRFLVDSFAKFKERFPGARVKCLLIGGHNRNNADYYQQIKTAIHERHLEEDVILYGQIPDPRPAFARLDIFVLPSIQAEPFGTVVLEAMVSKVPVIATAIGGTIEQVENEVSGILVTAEDTDQLASAIETLVFDREKRIMFAKQAFDRVATDFSVENYVARIQQLYDVLFADD